MGQDTPRRRRTQGAAADTPLFVSGADRKTGAAKRRRRTKLEIERLREAIYETLEAIQPATLRQLFYRLVVAAVIAKLETEYRTVAVQLLHLRRVGEVPYNWVADNTRWQRKPRTFSCVEDALANTVRTYRRALWDDQKAYVEIWCEKDALAGVILQETSPYDVPLMVSRGFSSESFLFEAAEEIKAAGKPAYLYYFGDHDPSGVHIDQAIRRGLERLAPNADIHFKRVAVLAEQIGELGLPTRPTKKSDSRSKTFLGESVEVDAIDPPRLRRMVREKIERHIDRHALEVTRVAERSEREILTRMAASFCRK
jgi:hypothetical protein